MAKNAEWYNVHQRKHQFVAVQIDIRNHSYSRSLSTLCFQENDAVFVMTNMIITPRQKQGTCPEDDQYDKAQCHHDDNCTEGQEVVTGHG